MNISLCFAEHVSKANNLNAVNKQHLKNLHLMLVSQSSITVFKNISSEKANYTALQTSNDNSGSQQMPGSSYDQIYVEDWHVDNKLSLLLWQKILICLY